MLKIRTISMAFALLLATLYAGPLSKVKLSAPKKPEIKYDRDSVKTVTIEKASVDFIYTVDNPNPFGIDNFFVDYELFIKDQSIGSGKDMEFKVTASGKSEIKMPLDIVFLNVFKSAEELTKAVLGGQKSIPFRLETKFKVDLKVVKFEVPLTATGEIPLPEVKPSAPSVKSITKLKKL